MKYFLVALLLIASAICLSAGGAHLLGGSGSPAATQAASAGGSALVQVVGAMVRVRSEEAVSGTSHAQLWAAQGEYEAFQIVLNGGGKGLAGVSVSVCELRGPDGAVLGSEHAILYRENYVHVTRSSPDPGGSNRPEAPGWFADGLIALPQTDCANREALPAATGFSVDANRNQPVWMDWYVPRGTKPGAYSGKAVVSAAGMTVDVPITLTVWRFTLPLQPSLKSSFGMHEPYRSDILWQELLLRHKLMPALPSAHEANRLRDELGLNIIGLPVAGDSNRLVCTMKAPPPVFQIAAQASSYPDDLPHYVYSADEIDRCPNLFFNLQGWALNLHNAGVRNLATVTPTPALYDDAGGSGRSVVDIWVVTAGMYNSAPDRIHQAMGKGDEVWSYTALVQDSYSPKWEIDFKPMNYRILPGFLNSALGLTGLLYWRVDLVTPNPWSDVQGYTETGLNFPGEGMLIYPNAEGGHLPPAPSMRLKWLREGVEDYEYMQLAKAVGRGYWAQALGRTVAANWKEWTQDPAVLESVRLQIGRELDRLSQ